MQIETNKLVKISTYAKIIGKSTMRVYQFIAEGKVKCIKIDGVKFIKIK